MSKKIFVVIFIIFCSFCLFSTVSAADSDDMNLTDLNDDCLQVSEQDDLIEESNEEILSHDSIYPEITFNKPQANGKVSGMVDIDVFVDSHNEVKYTNFTIENLNTKQVVFTSQDTNPSDGWGVYWDTSNAPNGKYYITAYAMDVYGYGGGNSLLISLFNQEKTTKITLDNSIGVVGQSTAIVAHLYDGNSNELAGRYIEFTIGNHTQTAKTGDDGIALIYYTPDEVKNYNVVAKFKGDNLYSSSQATMVLRTLSNSTTTVLTISNVTGNYKQNITIKANLKNPGFIEDSANKKIDFYIGSKHIGSASTDDEGNAEITYNISEVGGSYVYSAEYVNGSGETFKSFASLFVPESELYVTMIANKSNVKVGDKFTITYALFNLGPDNATNVIFTYNVVNSLKYVASSSSIGNCIYDDNLKEFKWIIGEVPVGNQTLSIIFQSTAVARNNLTGFLSTDTYDESVANGVPTRYLTVKSYAKLTANDLTKYYLGSEKYRVYVYGDDGKLVGSGVSVKVTINNKVFDLKTNANGFVDVPITFKAGKYTSHVVCNGLNISNKIVVKPTLITKDLSKKKSKVIKFKAKLLNTKGKALKSKKIIFKFKGKTYNVKTNKKGVATLKLKNLKVGTYKITTKYGKLTVKNTIKIKK